MAIPYDYYRIFYYVAQHKSFTKAAEALGDSGGIAAGCRLSVVWEDDVIR